MGFWGTAGATALGGILVAFVAAVLAILWTDKYAEKREKKRASHERDLAAAADLYQILGQFFAAWKVWDFHARKSSNHPPHPVSEQRHSELAWEAAAAEGAYEAFIVRVVLEHDLSDREIKALWCLRFALKQLRYAIRDNEPLEWRRQRYPGRRRYQAYKGLIPIVAGILTESGRKGPLPDQIDRSEALIQVTGKGDGFSLDELVEKEEKKAGRVQEKEWVLLAEQLNKTNKALPDIDT